MSKDLPIDEHVTIPAGELSWTASRASGPGGQNVNKVASKIQLRFDLRGTDRLTPEVKARLRHLARTRLDSRGRVVVQSQKTRDQTRNLEDARARLRDLVLRALVRPKPRRKTRPTRASRARRLDTKRRTSTKKELRGRVKRDE